MKLIMIAAISLAAEISAASAQEQVGKWPPQNVTLSAARNAAEKAPKPVGTAVRQTPPPETGAFECYHTWATGTYQMDKQFDFIMMPSASGDGKYSVYETDQYKDAQGKTTYVAWNLRDVERISVPFLGSLYEKGTVFSLLVQYGIAGPVKARLTDHQVVPGFEKYGPRNLFNLELTCKSLTL